MPFSEGKVLVVGLARSGIAAVRLLLSHGADVIINDSSSSADIMQAAKEFEGRAETALGVGAGGLLDGVSLIVLSPGVPSDAQFVKDARERGIEVIGEIELGYRCVAGRLVAITGTNGKSTTSTLVGEIFKNAGKLSHVVGNIGLPYTSIAGISRPDDVVVCEVSSFQLETISKFRPECSAILNFTQDHINRHGSMQAYIDTKLRIYENQKMGDYVVLNHDDPLVRQNAKGVTAKRVWFSRLEQVPFGAWVKDGQIVFGKPGFERAVISVDEIRIRGAHNLENALAATAIAASMEVQLPVIRHTLRQFAGIEHRIEFVREINGVAFINDSKGTNVVSTVKAVEAMDRPTVLILGGYDKQADFAPLSQAIMNSSVTGVVALGQTREAITKSLTDAGFTDIYRADSFAEAVRTAAGLAKPGENVLLSPACASYDMFKDFEERGAVFKRIVGMLSEGAL